MKEAARKWYDELSTELIKMGGQKLVGEPGCFIFHKDGKFVGFVIIHVDDIIIARTAEFVHETVGKLKARFRVLKDQVHSFIYTVMAL